MRGDGYVHVLGAEAVSPGGCRRGSQQLRVVVVVAVAAEERVVLEVARPLVGRDAHEVVPPVALVTADPGLTGPGLVPRLEADLAHGAWRHKVGSAVSDV